MLTLSAVAEHKGIAPERIEVRVGCATRSGTSQSTNFHIEIDVGGGLTNREQAILFHSARHCEVGKILSGKIDIDYALKR